MFDANYIEQPPLAPSTTEVAPKEIGEQYSYLSRFIDGDNKKIDFFKIIQPTGDEYKLHVPISHSLEQAPAPLTISEIVEKIRSVFGLNAVQTANLIGVSRPSLYNHISEKEQPKSVEAYNKVYELALLVEDNITVNLKQGLKTVIVEGKTLLQHLKQQPLDADKIVSVAQQIEIKLLTNAHPTPQPSNLRMTSRITTKEG